MRVVVMARDDPFDLTQARAIQVGAIQVGAIQVGAIQVGAIQVGAIQVGAGPVGAGPVGVSLVGVSLVGVSLVGVRFCHDGHSICGSDKGGYNSAMDSSGMETQVGRFLAS